MKELEKRLEALNGSERFWAAAVFCITVAAFAPALRGTELVSDDLFYFFNAVSVKNSPGNIFSPVLGLVTPLTSLSLHLDFLFWGMDRFVQGAKLVNILLHAASMVLLFFVIRQIRWKETCLTPAWAGMTVLIFALHPQRVESVAWIAERKDCLAMALGLGAFLLFRKGAARGRISWGSAGMLALSFLAKPMWIFFFLPAGALLLAERRRFFGKEELKLLLPSFGLFLVFVLWQLPAVLESAGKAASTGGVPLSFKLETIFYNYGSYFLRTFLPGQLFPVYPYYNPDCDPRILAAIPFLLLLTPLLARKPELREAVLFGVVPVLACFAAVLVPVVGFSRVGNTDFADRYSYLPSLFLVTGAAFLLRFNLPEGTALRRWLPVLAVLYGAGLLWRTELYLPAWNTNAAFVEYSLRHPEPNLNMAISGACDLFAKKKYAEALDLCRNKLPESPRYPKDFNEGIRIFKLALPGLILFRCGRPEEGIRFLNTVYMDPWCGTVRNLPIDFAQKVFTTGAEYHLKRYNDRKAAANLYMRCSTLFGIHSPHYAAFYAGMAALAEENNRRAAEQFRRAYELNPTDKRSLRNLDHALKKLKGKTP